MGAPGAHALVVIRADASGCEGYAGVKIGGGGDVRAKARLARDTSSPGAAAAAAGVEAVACSGVLRTIAKQTPPALRGHTLPAILPQWA